MDFKKKLLPIPVRNESAPKPEGEEIFKMPGWRCYCCLDTGWVQPHLAKLVIAEYDSNRDRTPVCQACDKGRQWTHLKGNVDMRLDTADCKELDKYERNNWEETVRKQFEDFQKNKNKETTNKEVVSSEVDKIAALWSLRQRARTREEESYAQYKHDLASSNRHELDTVEVCDEE